MSRLITDQKKELFKYTQELEEAYISILKVLAMAIDAGLLYARSFGKSCFTFLNDR